MSSPTGRGNTIRVQGAREHNLKNITVEMPREKLVVITGVSGSGKSSLAFDTIYAEGQRRYVESLSSYARQFLGQMEKPDVDLIEGLSPAISIEQKTTHRNPRSTVGTVTETYDYFRLLFARAGVQHCHNCGRKIQSVSIDQIVEMVQAYPEGAKLQILAPLIQGSKGEHKDVIEDARKTGFVRLRVNGEVRDLAEDINLPKNKKHTIELVVDRIVNKPGIRSRLADSLETALEKGSGMVLVNDGQEDRVFSRNSTCTHCNLSLPELTPRSFSFNSPLGACPNCDGLGVLLEFDEDLVVTDPDKSLLDGALSAWGSSKSYWFIEQVHNLGRKLGFDPETPFEKIPQKSRQTILYGSGEGSKLKFEGVLVNLRRRYLETKSDDMRMWLERFMSEKPCPKCKGRRLRPESLSVKFHGETIDTITDKNVRDVLGFFSKLHLTGSEEKIAGRIAKEIRERLTFLNDVGVGYLTLARSAGTLSGGEAQRIRLATQIGSSLMGVLYILDEPSIGLHQRDNDRLLNTLKNLRDLGNTVIVVEHDEDTIRAADYVIDIGPGAGSNGGYVVGQGTPDELLKFPESITGQYLSGKRKIEVPAARREGNGKKLLIKKAKENNLKGIDVEIPLGKFVTVTGVSGSGKSTLVNDILYKALNAKIGEGRAHPGKHERITGIDALDRVICIDQEPIGRTPRSNPATYTGLFTPIRDLFARLPEAKVRGYAPGRFSFNVPGGRCENCEGAGIIRIEMHFLPDVYVQCDVCKGKRFNKETLEVKFHGKSIFDVLEMTIEEGFEFFRNIPVVNKKLETLLEVGLGYISLGQAATTLSGGEAQRVKLATELSKRSTGKTLYILDEPTTGLHFEDIARLLTVLHSLVDRGNSMVIIEHNLDVIKTADHIIDLGPEGGDGGGQIIATGTPEEIVRIRESHTGEFLKRLLPGRKSA
ncbi:MAG: excinuclease ABC subunit UvrA [Leptospirales bacterium]|nr:excinuclease ABC subunit UvrA [Leptospirales bacterium]